MPFQPLPASGNEEKRSNDKSKRNNNNAIFLAPPAQSGGNAENGVIQIDQPSFYGSPLPTYSEDQEDNDNNLFDELGVEERGGLPSFQYPSMNFLIRQEEDGGILIEPASTPGKFRKSHLIAPIF